jgi:hypothetical protein
MHISNIWKFANIASKIPVSVLFMPLIVWAYILEISKIFYIWRGAHRRKIFAPVSPSSSRIRPINVPKEFRNL